MIIYDNLELLLFMTDLMSTRVSAGISTLLQPFDVSFSVM